MTTHTRSPHQTAISVSMPKSLVEEVDRRASALGLSRSQYLSQLARQDIAARGVLVIQEPQGSASSVQQAVNDQKVLDTIAGGAKKLRRKKGVPVSHEE